MQLIETAMDQAADVFKLNEDQQLLTALKTAGLSGHRDKVNELSVKFDEHADQLQEVCMSLMANMKWLNFSLGLIELTLNVMHFDMQLLNVGLTSYVSLP